MKYLDEAGLRYLLSKLREIYARKGEATGGSGSAWHTGTALRGTQSAELAREKPGVTLTPGNFGDPGNSKTAAITLTAQRELTGVTVSGEYHVEEYYDDFSLIVNGSKIIDEGHGERDWRQWWSGSLESGQTIQLIYTKDNSTSGKNEEQTRFEIGCDDLREDSFAFATGATPVESWTYALHAGGPDYAAGDYYLNTEERTLYRCIEADDSASRWDYICTLGGEDVDLSEYATRAELADYIPTSRESEFATRAELADYVTRDELAQAGSGKTINAAVIALDSDSFENDGRPHAPRVQSVLLEGQPLTENVDYALVPIREASAAGTYSVIAVGVGQYTGAACAAWRVEKPGPNLQLSRSDLTVKGVMGTADSSVAITRLGSGRLSAESLHPQFATADVVGSALRVTSVKPGSATIVVRVDEDDDYAAAEARLTVEIQRADGSISVQPDSLEISGAVGATATVAIVKTGSGAVSVSSDPCVTARVSGDQLTLTSVSAGSADLTLSLAQTDDYTAAGCSLRVQVSIDASAPTTTLADNSWATILETAAKGDAQKYWKAGDVAPKVTFTLPVKSGNTYDEETETLTCDVRILGFDHDDLDESDEKYNDPDYNGGKNKAAISFEMVGVTSQKYSMSNASGWKLETNPLSAKVLPIIHPDEKLMSNVRTVAKKTARMCNVLDIFNDPERMFILSIPEIYGTASGTIPGEGEQYAFYKNGGGKRKQDPSGAYSAWWTRSATRSTTCTFKAIQSLGFSGDTATSTELPICVCFCI